MRSIWTREEVPAEVTYSHRLSMLMAPASGLEPTAMVPTMPFEE